MNAMKKVMPEQVDAAVENVKFWLQRGQDASYEIEDHGDDTIIKIDGWVSLRHIVVEALEGFIINQPMIEALKAAEKFLDELFIEDVDHTEQMRILALIKAALERKS